MRKKKLNCGTRTGRTPAVNASISSTAPKKNPEENDFLCASMDKRAALIFGGVGGRGKDGSGLILKSS